MNILDKDGHIWTPDMKRYAAGKMQDESELAQVEKHLLFCQVCSIALLEAVREIQRRAEPDDRV